MSDIDQRPSTSRHCKKQLSPSNRSSGKNLRVTVNKFKKIPDDQQPKRVYTRTVYLLKDNETLEKITPRKVSTQRKKCKVLRKCNQEKHKKKKLHNFSSTLEDGEIRSDLTDGTLKNHDDDCVVIEPTLEEITVDDDDYNSDTNSNHDISINYQSLISSFNKCESSTPCHSRTSPSSQQTIMNMPNASSKHNEKSKTDDILPFFIDVGRNGGTESINSTDNFTDYTKLSTLYEESKPKRRSVTLKQTHCDDVEVIDLDDISNDSITTLKRKSIDMHDDSVVFVSETNKKDFIPIVDDTIPPHKILKISDPSHRTPPQKSKKDNLFTRSETKKLNEYNENAYNPSAEKDFPTGKRTVIIDGSNVAFKHGLDQQFSVKGLKIAIEYFEKLGHEVKAVIPQYRMNRTKSTNPEELERLHKEGKIVQTPCKNLPGYTSTSYDDRFILQLAFTMDAAIVSNDNYRDLLHENPAFKKIIENRVIGYTWCNDIFILPKDPYGKWGPTLHSILNRC